MPPTSVPLPSPASILSIVGRGRGKRIDVIVIISNETPKNSPFSRAPWLNPFVSIWTCFL